MAEKTRIPPQEREMLNGHYCSWWAKRGLLQTMTATYTFNGVVGYVLDLKAEWLPIERHVQAIEVVRKGTQEIEAAISGDDARQHGRPIRTPRGMRWFIPKWRWSKEPVPMRCLPCAMDRHDECDVDTGRSVNPTPCSCSEEHTHEEDPRPVRRRVVRRRRV
jgi:hypothetical protein